MATDEEYAGNVKRQLAKVFEVSLKETVPDEPDVEPLIAACTVIINVTMPWVYGLTPFKGLPSVGQAIIKNLPPSEMIESCSVAGPGFVNVVLSKNWMAQAFYKASKQRFDSDPVFKERAQQAVVRLQIYFDFGEENPSIVRHGHRFVKMNFRRVYERLGVHLEEEVLEELSKKGLIEESQGARMIKVEGVNIPLIVVKSDGGYNYASTDLAALWHRINEEKAEWIIYVTDVGQEQHFQMVFKAAKRPGWLPADDTLYPKTTHVSIGLVLGDDGKRFEHVAVRNWTLEEVEKTAEAVGYGAVKKSGKDIEELKKIGKIVLDHPDERTLGIHLLQFSEVVEEACNNILPNVLCEYLYNLSEIFTKKFYSNCQVVGSPEETSRLLLYEATATVMRKCFYLLGIVPVYKI